MMKFSIIKHLITSVFAALLSFMILVLLHPFGLAELPSGLVLNSLMIAGIIFIAVFLLNCIHDFWGVKSLTKSSFLNEIIYAIVISIIVGILIAVCLSGNEKTPFSFVSVARDIFYSFIMTSIVLSIVALTERNLTLRGELEEERNLNRMILKRMEGTEVSIPSETTMLTIVSTLSQHQLQIPLHDFLYATSSGNYVDIVYTKEGKIQKDNLRLTMKELESQLQPYESLTRCHRAFIVNINQIENVQGNSQGYTLFLRDTNDVVPVSRSYVDIIKRKLSAHSDSK